MKTFKIFESPIDKALFLLDEEGKIFLPSNSEGTPEVLFADDSPHQLRFATDGNSIYSVDSNSLGGWEALIPLATTIVGSFSSSQQQKQAAASAEKQAQLQLQAAETQARILALQQNLNSSSESSGKTGLIIGGVVLFAFLGVALVLFNRNEKKQKQLEGKKAAK